MHMACVCDRVFLLGEQSPMAVLHATCPQIQLGSVAASTLPFYRGREIRIRLIRTLLHFALFPSVSVSLERPDLMALLTKWAP